MLECIYFFIIGAFIGWVLEFVFRLTVGHLETTPGILNTPFCILYGLGTVVLSLVITNITTNFILLVILSMIILTIMEYATFVILQKVYGVKLWDYTNMKFNLNEKVCLEFSIIWGVLGAVYIKYLLPYLKEMYLNMNRQSLVITLYSILTVIVIDFIYSSKVLLVRKVKSIVTNK